MSSVQTCLNHHDKEDGTTFNGYNEKANYFLAKLDLKKIISNKIFVVLDFLI